MIARHARGMRDASARIIDQLQDWMRALARKTLGVKSPSREVSEADQRVMVDHQLCPAPIGAQTPCLNPLPCARHGVDNALVGMILYGSSFLRLPDEIAHLQDGHARPFRHGVV